MSKPIHNETAEYPQRPPGVKTGAPIQILRVPRPVYAARPGDRRPGSPRRPEPPRPRSPPSSPEQGVGSCSPRSVYKAGLARSCDGRLPGLRCAGPAGAALPCDLGRRVRCLGAPPLGESRGGRPARPQPFGACQCADSLPLTAQERYPHTPRTGHETPPSPETTPPAHEPRPRPTRGPQDPAAGSRPSAVPLRPAAPPPRNRSAPGRTFFRRPPPKGASLCPALHRRPVPSPPQAHQHPPTPV